MDKKQCEDSILFHLKQVVDILKEYDSDATYLHLCYMDGTIMFNDNAWDGGKEHIDYVGCYYGE